MEKEKKSTQTAIDKIRNSIKNESYMQSDNKIYTQDINH